jgi:signal transduction histidine kinase
MVTKSAPAEQQLQGDYLAESAEHALRYGRIFAALSIPLLAWNLYQDHALGFGPHTLQWRVIAIGASVLFLLASWTVLRGRPRLILAAHAALLAAPIINSAGLTVTLFLLRPEATGFVEGTRGALFVTIVAAFAFSSGARRYLWAIVGIPMGGLITALLVTDALANTEWALFTDIGIACVVVSVVGFQQDRIHTDEFRMRRLASLNKHALEKRLAELKQLNRQLKEFAYLVSHDLKEPLHTIKGFLGLANDLILRPEPDLDKAGEFLDLAQAGTERMSRLMEGLLTYSRVDTLSEYHQIVALEAVLEEVLANLAGSIRERGAQIHREQLPNVTGNARQLVQLFQNLVSNALKYQRPGAGPEVRISAETRDDQVTVTISDNGIGIDPEHHDRVFKLFQRLHTQGEYKGTGVGLAVVRRIVERHGGEIFLESAKGAGATFRVTLPTG